MHPSNFSGIWWKSQVRVVREICLLSLISPPGNDSFWEDLCFGGIYFLIFPRINSELRRPIGVKFCTMLEAACVQFYNPGPKFWGSLPNNFYGQNLARFQSTSKFGGECLRNGWRYSESVSYSIDSNSSRVRWNKSSEVWSSNLGDLDVELYPPKAHFSEDHVSAPNGCCATKFLHVLENGQVLLAHPPLGPRLQFFSKGG